MPTLLAYAVLAAAAAVSFMLPEPLQVASSHAAGGPVLRLNGVIRDLPSTHPDFGVLPPGGFGHIIDVVDLALGPSGRPVFNGGSTARRIVAEWRDSGGNAFAPNVYTGDPVGIRAQQTIQIDGGTFDSFDSSLGPYGPGNQGGDIVVSTNSTAKSAVTIASGTTINGDVLFGPGDLPSAPVIENSGVITGETGQMDEVFAMPVVVPPSDAVVGPMLGNVEYADDPFTISGNMHVNDFRVKTDAVVTISGHVTILVEGALTVETKGSIVVPTGSSLDLYAMGDIAFKTESAWSESSDTRLWVVGAPSFKLETKASFHGLVIAPEASLVIKTDACLYGGFIGDKLETTTGGLVIVDRGIKGYPAGGGGGGGGGGALPALPPCVTVADAPGSAVDGDPAGITSVETFEQWFTDEMGTNLSMQYSIDLTPGLDGAWEFLDDSFHPIDHRLLGNEGQAHNHYFTFTVHAEFVYTECGGQFLDFDGGDGAWVFVDGRLAMDLGGVQPGVPQHVEIDRVGDLVDGERYRLDFFYAQRDASTERFRLRTNIDLITEGYVVTVSNPAD